MTLQHISGGSGFRIGDACTSVVYFNELGSRVQVGEVHDFHTITIPVNLAEVQFGHKLPYEQCSCHNLKKQRLHVLVQHYQHPGILLGKDMYNWGSRPLCHQNDKPRDCQNQ